MSDDNDAVTAALRSGGAAINRETDATITTAEFALGVAAFLRALDAATLDTVPDVGFMDATACRNHWLAAVARATRALPEQEAARDA